MWLCLNNCFISVVHKNGSPKNDLTVRARRRGDIEKLFPHAKVITNAGTDYTYRTVVSRADMLAALTKVVLGIDYDNFKSSVNDKQLHDAYMGVWSVMLRTQAGGYPNYWASQQGTLFDQELDDPDLPDEGADFWLRDEEDEYEIDCPQCSDWLVGDPGAMYCPSCGYDQREEAIDDDMDAIITKYYQDRRRA